MRFMRQRLANERLVLAFNQLNQRRIQNRIIKGQYDNAPPPYEAPPPYIQINTDINHSIPSVSSNVPY